MPAGKTQRAVQGPADSGSKDEFCQGCRPGHATATRTPPRHLRATVQAKTSATVITVTCLCSQGRASCSSSAGYMPGLPSARVSTAESSHPAFVWPTKMTPSVIVTATQAPSSKAKVFISSARVLHCSCTRAELRCYVTGPRPAKGASLAWFRCGKPVRSF